MPLAHALDDFGLAGPEGHLLALAREQHLGRRIEIDHQIGLGVDAVEYKAVNAVAEPAVGAPVPAGFSCGPGRLAPAPDGSPTSGRFYGCQDVDYTPAYPLTLRIMATLYLA